MARLFASVLPLPEDSPYKRNCAIGNEVAVGKDPSSGRLFLIVRGLEEKEPVEFLIPIPQKGLSRECLERRSSWKRYWVVGRYHHYLMQWWRKYFLLSYKNTLLVGACRVNITAEEVLVFNREGQYLTTLTKGFTVRE